MEHGMEKPGGEEELAAAGCWTSRRVHSLPPTYLLLGGKATDVGWPGGARGDVEGSGKVGGGARGESIGARRTMATVSMEEILEGRFRSISPKKRYATAKVHFSK